ncbi:MAG: heavy-metal-associated domain-containing protein [Geminocystis sp.]|nr:heavy-metal-associated domain-containing protein [Geminocystis sp.]
MVCASCGEILSRAISRLRGVKECVVNCAWEMALVTYDASVTDFNAIQRVVKGWWRREKREWMRRRWAN